MPRSTGPRRLVETASRWQSGEPMLIIFGHQQYGRVDEHEGQYAHTRFFHLWYLPLIPTETVWILHDGTRACHQMKRSWRSILSGYGRVWGPVIALGGAAAAIAGSIVAIPVAATAAVAGGWSWRTRRLRGDRDRLRSSFHLLAYGTRCDPLQMTDAMVAALRPGCEARWAELADGMTPEDAARLGARSLQQAVFAYGVLRIAAREHAA